MRRHAFSLVEMTISLAIFATMALALGMGMITARKMSEGAVYQGLALTVATGYMEQIKAMDYQSLVNACLSPMTNPLPTKQDDSTPDPLTVGQSNTKKVVIDVDANGNTVKTMTMTITPVLTNLSGSTPSIQAIDIQLVYTWAAPESKVLQQRALRMVRSYAPTF